MADELVTAATFATASEAEAAKLTLEAEGIRALIDDTDWNTMGIPAPHVRLQVNQEDVEQATILLADHGHTLTSAEDDDAPDAISCLECGKEMPEGATQCPACGWTYVA